MIASFPLSRRVFWFSLLSGCAAMSLTFVAIQVTVRTKVRAIIRESAERTGKAGENGRDSRAIESALLARLVDETPVLLSAMNARSATRPSVIEEQLRRLREGLGYE